MTIDVEYIVREVVAELERRQQRTETSRVADAPKVEPHESKDHAHELVVSSRVVSLAEIGDRLSRIRRLVVRADAVITPSAKDAIEDRRIAVVHGSTGKQSEDKTVSVMLVVARTGYDPGGLAAGIRAGGMSVETRTSDCLIHAVDLLAEQVRDGKSIGLLLTPDVPAGVCLANRLAGVRAVAAKDSREAVEAARAVGANVLVVDQRGKGLFQLKQVVTTFCSGGPWQCPAPLAERLK